MKKKTAKYTGIITIDLPPALHAKVAAVARQANAPIETVLAVLLALQFPMPTSDRGEK